MRIFVSAVLLSVAGISWGQLQARSVTGLQDAPPSARSPVSQGGEGKTILLWPSGAPGAQGEENIDKPTLTIFLPLAPNPTKTGVVVAPGGSYQHLSMEKEGYAVARWLNERGVAAFVLKYRLGPKYRHPVELGDAQRALRIVRAHAAEYGVAEDHIGIWGFSAGGHLAATAGTQFDAGNWANGGVDDAGNARNPELLVESKSSRPDFLILAYPVITMLDPWVHMGSRQNLLGDAPDPALERALSAELQVTKDTPPTFLFATTDDKTVPVMNSVMFYEALVKAGVPAEMHLFQHGGHGAGLAAANPQLSVWPELLIKWMSERGYAEAGVGSRG